MRDPQILNLMLATVPMMLTVLIGILINNARLSDLRHHVDMRLSEMDKLGEQRFKNVYLRFDEVDRHFGDVDRHFVDVDRHFGDVDRRFGEIDLHFEAVDRRFVEIKELWRSELNRVEEILDVRLKHLEESKHH